MKRNVVWASSCPGGWGGRIHRLFLYRGVTPTQRVSWLYDTKQSDGEVPVMLELWGMWSIPSFPSLPVPLWSGVVGADRVLSRGQIELNSVLILNRIVWSGSILYAKMNCLK